MKLAVVFSVMVSLVVLLAAPAAASAQPSFPHIFCGTLVAEAAPAGAGATVEGRAAGAITDESNPIVTDQAGQYGLWNATGCTSGLLVQGNVADGAVIEFFINGVKANETATRQSTGNTRLDLTVGAIDAAAPSIALTLLATDPTSATGATLAGTASDADGNVALVEYRLDAGAWTAATPDDGAFNGPSEAFSLSVTGLAAGSHTIWVRASDAAGHVTAQAGWASDTFMVDTVAPSVTLTPFTPDPTNSATVGLSGAASDAHTGVALVEYRLDAGAWAPATPADGAFDGPSESFTLAVTALAAGSHTVQARATDAVGNVTAEANWASDALVVDTVAPSVTLTPFSPDPTTNTTVVLNGAASDTQGNVILVQYRLDAGAWATATPADGAFDGPSEGFSFTMTGLTAASHTVQARAVDSVGNVTAEANWASDNFLVLAPTPTPLPPTPAPTTPPVGGGGGVQQPTATPVPAATPTPTPTATPTPTPTITPTPGPTVEPTPTPTPTPLPAAPAVSVGEIEVELHTEDTVDRENAGARDDQGNEIGISGDAIRMITIGGQVAFTLPIALPAGATLKSFDDPGSGMRLVNDNLIKPLKDATGQEVMRIVAKVEGVQGTGVSATVVVQSMSLRTTQQQQDFSAADPTVGTVGASVEVELKALPDGSGVRVTVEKEPDAQTRSSFQLAASGSGQELRDVAFVMNVRKTAIENVTHLGAAAITMRVASAWVEAQGGAGNVKIIRVADSGETEVLETAVAGTAGGVHTFVAASPNGLSAFGLAAVAAQVPPTPTSTPAPQPTATPVPQPTATPVPQPTPTTVPSPTPTPTPQPTPTAVPQPTPTVALQPTATTVPQPTPTAPQQQPPATPTPEPLQVGTGGFLWWVAAVIGGIVVVAAAGMLLRRKKN